MSPNSRAKYFGLWASAKEAQGWRFASKDEETAKRHEINLAATGVSSSTAMNEHQISALFARLVHLSRPGDLKAALADAATPAQIADANKRRQLVWKIRQTARRDGVRLNDAYIQAIAAWDRREAQVSHWTDLPEPGLRRVLAHVNQRANEKDPTVHHRGPRRRRPVDAIVYQMKPRTMFAGGKA